MKNLEKFYAQHFEGKLHSLTDYIELMNPVRKEQALFKLDSREGDTGFLLRSDDGTFHIWFLQHILSPVEGYQIVETGTWYPNQLSEAMNDLMNQMKIDCEGLIERNGQPVDADGIPL